MEEVITIAPDVVYPFSIILETGEDLPPEYGRACLEETDMFGREAALYLSLEDPKLRQWLGEFAF